MILLTMKLVFYFRKDLENGRFLYTVNSISPGITTITKLHSPKQVKKELQNDLISGLPRRGSTRKPKHNLDIISHCPPDEYDEFDDIEKIMAVRYVFFLFYTPN